MREPNPLMFISPLPLFARPIKSRHASNVSNIKAFPKFAPRRRIFSTRASLSATTLTEGLLLQFQTSAGRRRLARALRPDGKRNWIVEDATGQTSSVTPKQVTYVLGTADTIDLLNDDLKQLETECIQRAEDSSDLLELAWEIISSGDSNMTTIEHVAKVLFNDTSRQTLFTTYIILSTDDIYFKERNIKGEIVFEARTESIVIEAKQLQEANASKAQAEEELRRSIELSYQNQSFQILRGAVGEHQLGEDQLDLLVDGLKTMALECEGSRNVDARYASSSTSAFKRMEQDQKHLIREVLTTLKKPINPSAALDVLIAWRIFSKHENLTFLKYKLANPLTFDTTVIQLAEQLMHQIPEDPDHDARIDLTHLQSFAVDSSDTTEIDDAISWDPESRRVFVHIADPTRYLTSSACNPILQQALRRAATLYLPYDKITMFPPTLANRLFSLTGDLTDSSALSFAFRILDDGSLAEEDSTVQTTRISQPIRLTYEATNQVLSEPAGPHADVLNTLYNLAKRRLDWRIMEGGAIAIAVPFSEVTVTDFESEEPEIKLGITRTDDKAWTLVSELMITACSVGAEVAAKSEIPMPFRGQQPFDYPPDDVLEAVPDGPARASLAFRNATASEMSTEPIEHASLGLDAYVQVTSPIRRSADLISHFQLKALLRGEPSPFSAEEIQREIARSRDVGKSLRIVENQTKKYWQFEYLRRVGPSERHRATYVRPARDDGDRNGVVHLEDYGMQITASTSAGMKPGEALEVQVLRADPRTGKYQAEAIRGLSLEDTKEFENTLDDIFSDVSSDVSSDISSNDVAL